MNTSLSDSETRAYYYLGCAHYQQNDLAAAEKYFAAAVDRRYKAYSLIFTQSVFGLAAVYQARGQASQALAASESAASYALEVKNLAMLADARAFDAHLALLQGEQAAARQWAAQCDRSFRSSPMPMFYASPFTLVEVLLTEETPASLEEAMHLLARLREHVQSTHNTRFLIEALALQALLHDARHEQSAALDVLEQAIALAEPGGLIRVFVDRGPRMAALLQQLAAQRARSEFSARLLAAFPVTSSPASAPHQPSLIEPLSERELEVLALLAQRLTNKEIARSLSISPMTVKRHSSNIYQKLAVGGRREAVAKGVALGLVSVAPTPRLPMLPETWH